MVLLSFNTVQHLLARDLACCYSLTELNFDDAKKLTLLTSP